MASLSPCSRSDFVKKLRVLGYDGPYPGGNHMFMTKHGGATVAVPNPHQGDISVGLLSRILRDAKIARDEWMKA
jgi:predicted RNA binding protein YcfA (HicA-like mRNA interferase family)